MAVGGGTSRIAPAWQRVRALSGSARAQAMRDDRDRSDSVERLPGRGVSVESVLPSGRSLVLAFAILVAALLLWVLARESSLFATQRIEVDGASPAVATQVRRVLKEELGRNLLKLDVAEIQAKVERLPTVAFASVDRAFPHGLRIAVVSERGVALFRQGSSSWVVSSRGRVMRAVEPARRALSKLPRVWIPADGAVAMGEIVTGELATAVKAVAPLAKTGFRSTIATVKVTEDDLTLRLRSGLELRLGNPSDTDLKLSVAAKILPLVADGTRYVDVSVPDRPVAGTLESQVEVESSTSTRT